MRIYRRESRVPEAGLVRRRVAVDLVRIDPDRAVTVAVGVAVVAAVAVEVDLVLGHRGPVGPDQGLLREVAAEVVLGQDLQPADDLHAPDRDRRIRVDQDLVHRHGRGVEVRQGIRIN